MLRAERTPLPYHANRGTRSRRHRGQRGMARVKRQLLEAWRTRPKLQSAEGLRQPTAEVCAALLLLFVAAVAGEACSNDHHIAPPPPRSPSSPSLALLCPSDPLLGV